MRLRLLAWGKTRRQITECTEDLKKFHGYRYENTRLNIGFRYDALAGRILAHYPARVLARALVDLDLLIKDGLKKCT